MSKIYKHYSEIIMSKIHKHYSEEAKLSLIRSYYQSGQSKKRFCISHDIWCIGLLNSWLKKYEISQEMVSLCSEPASVEDMANRSKDSYKEEVTQLKKRIKDLEKALDYSKLETLARDILIDAVIDFWWGFLSYLTTNLLISLEDFLKSITFVLTNLNGGDYRRLDALIMIRTTLF